MFYAIVNTTFGCKDQLKYDFKHLEADNGGYWLIIDFLLCDNWFLNLSSTGRRVDKLPEYKHTKLHSVHVLV